ncbi:hypothetical protein PR048_026955 [Dryococelus australis]|uniref:DDE-1 domain-containing protein n=1 Tax=Dryococelus australis TaxID=614101 RepID=A0ABQ9GMR3_9NEOP|nr:hypothetical protein PR048_026955 [Dryococelus australis]
MMKLDFMTPKKGKYLFRRQNRHPEIIWNFTKSCFTVMFCGSASGELLSPYFVFKGKNKMSDWLMDGPKGSRLNVSKSGWVDLGIYEDWFGEHLLPRLRKYPRKKVIICDNLAVHMSLRVLKLCEENDISFVSLIPDSAYLLQPLDGCFFFSTQNTVASCLAKMAGSPTRATGIYPTSRERVIAKLPAYANPAEVQQNMPDTIGAEFKAYIDSMRGEDLVPKQKAREDAKKNTKDPSLKKSDRPSGELYMKRHQQASTSGGAAATKKKLTR